MPAEAASSQTGPREMEEEEEVYVAVVKQVKEGKANLAWVLQNTSKYCKIVLLHVHQPAKRIPTALGWFLASQLEDQEVAAYRRMERENMHRNLDEYVNMCSQVKVHKAEKLVIEMDDIAKGLTESIISHGITKLVMGAAACKNYSRCSPLTFRCNPLTFSTLYGFTGLL
ncbi:U-box domain-containing protein 33-like [Curcuma longa]|uniref:U-box domain-containing protein 33-like n=1 Tax=Curcuma longa TaxID=136217 RepID=UPI003D9ECD83